MAYLQIRADGKIVVATEYRVLRVLIKRPLVVVLLHVDVLCLLDVAGLIRAQPQILLYALLIRQLPSPFDLGLLSQEKGFLFVVLLDPPKLSDLPKRILLLIQSVLIVWNLEPSVRVLVDLDVRVGLDGVQNEYFVLDLLPLQVALPLLLHADLLLHLGVQLVAFPPRDEDRLEQFDALLGLLLFLSRLRLASLAGALLSPFFAFPPFLLFFLFALFVFALPFCSLCV